MIRKTDKDYPVIFTAMAAAAMEYLCMIGIVMAGCLSIRNSVDINACREAGDPLSYIAIAWCTFFVVRGCVALLSRMAKGWSIALLCSMLLCAVNAGFVVVKMYGGSDDFGGGVFLSLTFGAVLHGVIWGGWWFSLQKRAV